MASRGTLGWLMFAAVSAALPIACTQRIEVGLTMGPDNLSLGAAGTAPQPASSNDPGAAQVEDAGTPGASSNDGTDRGKDSGSDRGWDSGSDRGWDGGWDSGRWCDCDHGWDSGHGCDCDRDASWPVMVTPQTACFTDYSSAQQAPIDLYFMVSTAGSMDCPTGSQGETCTRAPTSPVSGPTRWSEMRTALEQFWSASENAWLNVGLGFFPRLCSCQGNRDCSCTDKIPSISCSAADYAYANAEIQGLSSYASGTSFGTTYANFLSYTIKNQTRAGSTPSTAALAGALQHASSWATSHSGHRVAVVYATDAMPTDCSDDTLDSDPAKIAQSFATGPNAIPTYVLGVGPNLDGLDSIARGGSTEKAYLVDTGGDVAAHFADAFNSIRDHMLSCDYTLPKQSRLDWNNVAIFAATGAMGTPTFVPRVATEADCKRSGGWYYDDPEHPKVISLCRDTTCQSLLSTTGSHFQVLIGCAKN